MELLTEEREPADDEQQPGARNHRQREDAAGGDEHQPGRDAEASQDVLGHPGGGFYPFASEGQRPGLTGGRGRAMPTSRRTRRMDTREKILETAVRLFSMQGYATTSLSQVAKEATVSKALIFWHFENKETLFRTVVQRALEPYFINVLDDLAGLSEPDQIVRLVEEYFDFVSENQATVRFLLGLVVREEQGPENVVAHMTELAGVYRKLLAEIIEGGQQAGVLRADVDPAAEAALLMSALHGIVLQHFLGGGPDARQLLAHLSRRLIDTLRRDGGGGPP